MVHPDVLDAHEKAIRVLRKARIPYRETGGIALNFYGAGRPTRDVDLIVRRTDWSRAIRALGRIATDQPGVPIEFWPEGMTHEQIARIRGMQKARAHPAGKLAFTMQGDAVVGLVNDKLASYLSAKDRLRDAADVQSLIRRLRLPLGFAARLAPEVRAAYRRVWVKPEG